MQPAEGIVQLTADLARVVEIGEELRKIRSARQQVGGRFSRPQSGMPTVDGASQGRRVVAGVDVVQGEAIEVQLGDKRGGESPAIQAASAGRMVRSRIQTRLKLRARMSATRRAR